MYSFNEMVEIDACLGEDQYGIPRSNFEIICKNRIAKIISRRQIDASGRFFYKIRTNDMSRDWCWLEERMKKLEVQNDNRNEA